MTPRRRVLVTGATGFVGRSVCRRLHAEGHLVVGAARSESDGPWQEFVRLDVSATTPDLWPVEPGTVVVHAAGIAHDVGGHSFTEADYHAVNARGAESAALAVREHRGAGMVLLSTVKVISDSTGLTPLDESADCHPTSAYGRAKLDGERLAGEALADGPPLAVLRLTPVYGPGTKGNLDRLVRMAEKRWMPLLPKGRGCRSMVHVDDVASLVCRLVGEPKHLLAIVSDGNVYGPRQIQDAIRSQSGWRGPRWAIPAPVITVLGAVGSLVEGVGRREFPFTRRESSRLLSDGRYTSRVQFDDWAPAHQLEPGYAACSMAEEI